MSEAGTIGAQARLTADELVRRWPRLYHMAEAGSWASIERHGLLSTTALVDLFAITGARRVAIEAARRPAPVRLVDPVMGEAWIRFVLDVQTR